jgi:hypothetical protein
VLHGQRVANRPFDLSVVVPEKVEPDHVEITRVAEVAQGREGNVDDAVDAVLAFLRPWLQYTNHLVGNAVDANLLSQGETSREQFFLGLRAQHAYVGAQLCIFGAEESPRLDL